MFEKEFDLNKYWVHLERARVTEHTNNVFLNARH